MREAFAAATAEAEAEAVLSPGATYTLTGCLAGPLTHGAVEPLTITGNGATVHQSCPATGTVDTSTPGSCPLSATTRTTRPTPRRSHHRLDHRRQRRHPRRRGIDVGITESSEPTAPPAMLAVTDSSVSGNVAESVGVATGGGISTVGADVTLTRSVVSDNTAPSAGGIEVLTASGVPAGAPHPRIDPRRQRGDGERRRGARLGVGQ